MGKKIALLTSGHPPFDERIYWKFAHSLAENNYSVAIICSTQKIDIKDKDIAVKGFEGDKTGRPEKIRKFQLYLEEFAPDLIICCEPLTILPAHRYKKNFNNACKIVSDITEWYPENVALKYRGIKRIAAYIFLFKLNILMTNMADALIIGETGKKKRYDLTAPFKPKIIIGYYPVLKYFDYNPPQLTGKNIVLCYAGLISFERGILILLDTGERLAQKHPGLFVKIKLAGKFQSQEEERIFDEKVKLFKNITVEKAGWTKYPKISEIISDADVCFDLRRRNFIYKNSLPIKIFEYMACGKPFIFSHIEPIKKELGNINCGFLVDPNDIDAIVSKIESYLSDKELFLSHSKNGRMLIETGKNWEEESKKLIELADKLTRFENTR